MPKVVIDYSNTIIYKITCNDLTVKDIYVGHTTNFVQRKHAHKNSCSNEKTSNYNCKLYQAIRNNGGWNNWNMEIINFFNCKDHYDARKKEQEYFELLNATLNSIEPMPKPKTKCKNKDIPNLMRKKGTNIAGLELTNNASNFLCEKCNYITPRKQDYEMHLLTVKHQRTQLETNINLNISSIGFRCNECTYTTLKKNLFEKHQTTIKHIRNIKREPTSNVYICKVCNKEYLHRSGYYKHIKICKVVERKTESTNEMREPDKNKPIISVELFMDLMRENKELQICLLESHNKIIELSQNLSSVNNVTQRNSDT
jgi:hypothetical protein